MKKLALVALATISTSALSTSALAWEPEFYAGGGFATWQYSNTSINTRAGSGSNYSIQSLEGVAGLQVIKYLKVEGRLGTGISTGRETAWVNITNDVAGNGTIDDVTTVDLDETADDLTFDIHPRFVPADNANITLNSITQVEAEMTYFASLYVRPEISNEKASLYALIGVTTMETTLSVNAAEATDTFTAGSYGIGASFYVNEQFDVNLEWKKLINDSDFDMRGGSVSFTYSF